MKRFQLLILWNRNHAEAMPTVKVSWEQLEELARKVNKKYPNNTELHFIEWDTDTGAITLGSFGSKVFEEEEDET